MASPRKISTASHSNRISNIAQVPQRLCVITDDLNRRRGTVDEKATAAQISLFGRVEHGVDPFLDSELARIKDNGLLRAMILQMLDVPLMSQKSCSDSSLDRVTCSDALMARIRRLRK